MTPVALEQLAVRFRLQSNIAHSETRDVMGRLGGDVAIFYGSLLATPARCHRKRNELAHLIARLLDDRAKEGS